MSPTREAVVLELYRRGIVSSGKAAELLGMQRFDFVGYADKLGIPFSANAARASPTSGMTACHRSRFRESRREASRWRFKAFSLCRTSRAKRAAATRSKSGRSHLGLVEKLKRYVTRVSPGIDALEDRHHHVESVLGAT